MNPIKAEKIFSLMKQYGIEYFKHEDLEIKMQGTVKNTEMVPSQPSFFTEKPLTKPPESQAIPPVEVSIPHHVNEVANLLKLNDNDLVDKLFPDYSQLPVKDGE